MITSIHNWRCNAWMSSSSSSSPATRTTRARFITDKNMQAQLANFERMHYPHHSLPHSISVNRARIRSKHAAHAHSRYRRRRLEGYRYCRRRCPLTPHRGSSHPSNARYSITPPDRRLLTGLLHPAVCPHDPFPASAASSSFKAPISPRRNLSS